MSSVGGAAALARRSSCRSTISIGGTSAAGVAKNSNRRGSVTSVAGASSTGEAQSKGPKVQQPIRLVHSFGTHSQDVGALLLDEETVLHRTGRWLVTQSADPNYPDQGFLYELHTRVNTLTAMCITDNRKYLALCEQVEPAGSPPQLRVVHIQSRRSVCVLTAALEGAFVGCTFSADGKHVLAYTGGPEHVTVVWQWAEERPVGMHRSRQQLLRVSFNPWMGSLISLNSPMRIARLNDEGKFKEIEVCTHEHARLPIVHIHAVHVHVRVYKTFAPTSVRARSALAAPLC